LSVYGGVLKGRKEEAIRGSGEALGGRNKLSASVMKLRAK